MLKKKCQVFTPIEYVEELLDHVGYKGSDILNKVFLENSVGEGHILVSAVRRFLDEAKILGIEEEDLKLRLQHCFKAFEIDPEVVKVCIKNLNELTSSYGIKGVIQWEIRLEDYLHHQSNFKADYIVGNPPYVNYSELEEEERNYLKNNFQSCSKGKFDYCYAFIEKSLSDLRIGTGKMAYFVPSSIFKNTFGEYLREMMRSNITEIIDYPHRRVFKNVLASPAMIIFEQGTTKKEIHYQNKDEGISFEIPKSKLHGKWIFSNQNVVAKNSAIKFGDYFEVSNSVATLLNEAFVISDNHFGIEKEILRPAASPRSLANNKSEQIIFPYYYDEQGQWHRYSEKEFMKHFPYAAKHLKFFSKKLAKRKAGGTWFEYGRTQALGIINQKKLVMSSVITNHVKVYPQDTATILYSGFFITSKIDVSLSLARKILESKEFETYIFNISIHASGHSIRTTAKDIRNFDISSFI